MDSNSKGVEYYEAKFSFAPSDCWHAAAPLWPVLVLENLHLRA